MTDIQPLSNTDSFIQKIGNSISGLVSTVTDSTVTDSTVTDSTATDSPVIDRYIDTLYPETNDPDFSIKIAKKKEFSDWRYDGTIHENINNESKFLCGKGFELAPHQHFVRNFLSFQTPYNTLLLYHGLGSGKTCSAIGVTEDMREYLKQLGVNKRIIIVASPNVQENFKLQLFNPAKLTQQMEGGEWNGIWSLDGCTGSTFIRIINPSDVKFIPKERIISKINNIIKHSYMFMGYIEFANYIVEKTKVVNTGNINTELLQYKIKSKLNAIFSDRLVVIDEIHNIRISNTKEAKLVATNLDLLVNNVKTMRLLLLSATPVYNNPSEIIWLTNLLNRNNANVRLVDGDIFDSTGKFIKNEVGKEIGKDLLNSRLTGFISYVRGEHPYTFPYRIWPQQFVDNTDSQDEGVMVITDKIDNSIDLSTHSVLRMTYPSVQMNGNELTESVHMIDLFVNRVDGFQQDVYKIMMDTYIPTDSRRDIDSIDEDPPLDLDSDSRELIDQGETGGSYGYTVLQRPIEALNIVFPTDNLKSISESENRNTGTRARLVSELIGKKGLARTFDYKTETTPVPFKGDFKYKPEIKAKFGRFLSPPHIGKYSKKIETICKLVARSTGIIMVYSQYIDGGLVPLALALEEMGIRRYGGVSGSTTLFDTKNDPIKSVDYRSIQFATDSTATEQYPEFPAHYVMITGDKSLSESNVSDLEAVNRRENFDGSVVKVVLISQAGSEGIDFKNIRQVHVLDPWYNMSRTEQILGRAVRNCSHSSLDLSERNVQIFLHASLMNESPMKETVDLYLYRISEEKAIRIGEITRLMKETAVDCLIHENQGNFTAEQMNQTVQHLLSSGERTSFKIGDKPYTAICDYKNTCEFKCSRELSDNVLGSDTTSYSEPFINSSVDIVVSRIRLLMRDHYFLVGQDIISRIMAKHRFSKTHIYAALTRMVGNTAEPIYDEFGREGVLNNIGTLYYFQPIELIDNPNISNYDRMIPINVKRNINIKVDTVSHESTNIDDKGPMILISNLFKTYTEMVVLLESDPISDIKLEKGPKSDTTSTRWNRTARRVLHDMKTKWDNDITNDQFKFYVTSHFVDLLPPTDLKLIIDYYINYTDKTDSEQTVVADQDMVMFRAFTEEMFRIIYGLRVSDPTTQLTGFVIPKQNFEQGYDLLIQHDGETSESTKVLRPAQFSETNILIPVINTLLVDSNSIAPVTGFISKASRTNEMVFRVKNMDKLSQSGTVCSQTSGTEIMKRLRPLELAARDRFFWSEMQGDKSSSDAYAGTEFSNIRKNIYATYMKNNLINQLDWVDKDKNGKDKAMTYKSDRLCVIVEILLRHYDSIRIKSKRWFFTPTLFALNHSKL